MKVFPVQNYSNNNSNYQNKSKNVSFGSKIIGLTVGRDAADGLKGALRTAFFHRDRTFLKAIKGLINDGKKDTYIYKVDKGWRYREDFDVLNSATNEKKSYHMGDTNQWGNYLFRDIIVDTARQKGLIPGKSIGINNIIIAYNDVRVRSYDIEEVRKSLKNKGFERTIPKTMDDEEKALVQDELNELENLKSSNSQFKDKYIKLMKDRINKKINLKVEEELRNMADNPRMLSL